VDEAVARKMVLWTLAGGAAADEEALLFMV